jgi:hypothetical protein
VAEEVELGDGRGGAEALLGADDAGHLLHRAAGDAEREPAMADRRQHKNPEPVDGPAALRLLGGERERHLEPTVDDLGLAARPEHPGVDRRALAAEHLLHRRVAGVGRRERGRGGVGQDRPSGRRVGARQLFEHGQRRHRVGLGTVELTGNHEVEHSDLGERGDGDLTQGAVVLRRGGFPFDQGSERPGSGKGIGDLHPATVGRRRQPSGTE